MKHTAILLLVIFGALTSSARPVRLWSYTDLEKESDVILLCQVDSPTSRTTKKVKKPGWDGLCDEVITGFNIQAKLKGEYPFDYFQLHHLAYPEDVTMVPNGCGFSWFPKKNECFLIFLKSDEQHLNPTSGYCDSYSSFIPIPQDEASKHSKTE
jgi:hypothetical protein